MIERDGRQFYVQCDYCCNQLPAMDNEWYETFMEAVNDKKANGWKSVLIKGEWYDKCPVCQEKGEWFGK